jgi:hypothetical protein
VREANEAHDLLSRVFRLSLRRDVGWQAGARCAVAHYEGDDVIRQLHDRPVGVLESAQVRDLQQVLGDGCVELAFRGKLRGLRESV